ncbi:MAG: hypothetical protein IPN86_11665 [Saprospiraceae bacterium]|nr:hypothetical protein [Saprospiraceae bacterium]
MEWKGDGDMPEEMAKELKNININKVVDGDNMTITIDAESDDQIEGFNRDGKPKNRK